jgi:hypothetical protein
VLGVVMVGCGLVVPFAVGGAPQSAASDVSHVAVPAALETLSVPSYAAEVAPTSVVVPTALTGAPTVDQWAIARAKQIGAAGNWTNLCLGFVREMFGLPIKQASAIAAWQTAVYKHIADANPPAGVPVFWSGGSAGAGHVAYSLGDGMVISTDLPAAGYVSEVPLSWIQAKWGLTYLGWTEDLEGIRVYAA